MTSSVDITALADEIASLAKSYTNPNATAPGSIGHVQAQQAIVIKAKNLINQVQNPWLAPMEHSTHINWISATKLFPVILCLDISKGCYSGEVKLNEAWSHLFPQKRCDQTFCGL
jgi:hypothetical protein